jgi:hypothetical protein
MRTFCRLRIRLAPLRSASPLRPRLRDDPSRNTFQIAADFESLRINYLK